MALSAKLQVRQTQALVITPQLMQAIRLLQMSGAELERFIAAEVEQNPLLDQEEGRPDSISEEDEIARDATGETASEVADAEPVDLLPSEAGPEAGWMQSAAAPSGGGSSADLLDFSIEQRIAATQSLAELLEQRIQQTFPEAADRLIALSLLAGLDEAGYLTVAPESIAVRLGAELVAVERVLRECQELAPTGIFARSLAECLALQLAERNRLDPAMQILLCHLPLLAAGDLSSLSALCGVGRGDLDDMIVEIRSLNPKPGLVFDCEPVQTLVPDVFVRPAPDGSWSVELNDALLPRLIVDRIYYAKVSTGSASEEDRRYLSECLQKASWLEKSLDQRARTVLKVAAAIVRRQDGFLSDGVAFLRPLTLRMVADELGIHESTVSRATANKHIATPRGIFEFRYFFTGGFPASAGGEAHSAEAVKHWIRKLILEESPTAALSDDAIVARLSRHGIQIARRTVAKYREMMGIGSSVGRRRDRRVRAAS
ncbi:MAG TPA: RNA polymerase factor sigma-54 [Propylenella sp.]|nr:RNA polymerase factor sigma-54 [Propylenella sp.]